MCRFCIKNIKIILPNQKGVVSCIVLSGNVMSVVLLKCKEAKVEEIFCLCF